MADKTYKMQIPPDKVEQTRAFFRDRGGVLLWYDQEIRGTPRPALMTPATHEDGSPAASPHWAYGAPELLKPEDIGVRTETLLEPPADVTRGDACDYCGGTGRYPVAKIAAARECCFSDALEWCRWQDQGGLKLEGDTEADATVHCTACAGRGHRYKPVLVRLKRHWTGGFYPVSMARAERIAVRLGNDVLVTWEHDRPGLGRAVFYREQITPFTLE